jgi:hypothetical protein
MAILFRRFGLPAHKDMLNYSASFIPMKVITKKQTRRARTFSYCTDLRVAVWAHRTRLTPPGGFDLILILVFNATFSNISAISWQPVVVVEEAGVPRENHRSWASNW